MGIGPALRRAVAEVDGNAVVTDLVPMDSLVSASSAPLRFRARLLGAFALLALLLAAAGTYGVMSCIVEQRTAEIGMRMAVGADAGVIFAMVLGRGSALAGTGLTIGIFGGLMLRRVMATLLFETQATDPVALAAAAALLLLAALGACGAPSLRAARLDPLAALRQER
jgi:putative ABC transport system permease protein